jgi:hypothetical protein
MRPRSIILFERIYGFSIVLGLVLGALMLMRLSSFMPAGGAPQVAAMIPTIMVVSMVGGIAINLLLLFFIARRGSNVAKWIFVVLFALAVIGMAGGLLNSAAHVTWIARLPSIVQIAIQAVCVWLLFRPDAAAWLEGRALNDLTDTFS